MMAIDVDALVETELRALDHEIPRAVWERVLIGPARDVLSRPGKQFRARLLIAGWTLAGRTDSSPPDALTAAIEVLHAGSLVIDDIEDAAEERRGDVALHRRYGVPVALNAGNWMYFWAFALVDRAPLPEATRIQLHRAMLRGVLDCHAGQALDVGQDITAVPRGELRTLVARSTALKSGALARLATELGAIAAGADADRLAEIGAFGGALGLGLQMLDDLGTVTCECRLAKSREDLLLARPTWPWVWAAESCDDATWARLVRWTRQIAARREDPLPLARVLGRQVIDAGRADVARQLGAALELARAIASHEAYALVEAEVRRLEVSYGQI